MKEEFELLRETFRQEAQELLSEIEIRLLELERTPGDKEVVSALFRTFHTLKGSGAMCGFEEVSQFTHHIETVYDLVRDGKVPADQTLIDLTLEARDFIQEMIRAPFSEKKGISGRQAELLTSFRKLIPKSEAAGISAAVAKKDHPRYGIFEKQVTYRIRFRPSRGIFLGGTNPVLLLKELARLGECRIIAHTEEIPFLDEIDAESCYTYWDIILTTAKEIEAIKDVFIFVEGECELKIDVVDDGMISLEEKDYRKLGEILVEKKDLSTEDLNKVLDGRKPIGMVLVEEGLVPPASVQAALAEQEHVRQIRERRLKEEGISNLRVASEKLDKLVNLVGELVTVQARLTQTAMEKNDPELVLIAEEVERLTADLRDNTMDMRLLPIGTTFSKFRRLVRDLSVKLGKDVELFTEGAETELDKTVIEKLNDPLVHLIRNCIDHGIELPEVREKAGKSRKARVHLSAVHSGANVLIRVNDDGAGLDREAIRLKAVERGLIPSDAMLTEKEVFSLILAPGFTTAGNVTTVSGRGVGMDVVKRAVENLRGSIDISSRKGEGTTITLSLPLTLAIIEGLLVRVAGECFVLPLFAVEECIELTRQDREASHGRHVANVRGQIVPYVRLREQFRIGGEAPEREQIVIITESGHRVGFAVDHVIGEHQTVIKALGRVFRNIEGISGATILGNGTVALILDIRKLVEIAEHEEVNSFGGV
jgi:two-component system chemotaxis sensor kinase CheA